MIYVFAGNRIIIVSGEFLPNDLTISCKVCGKRKIAIWNQRGAVNFDLVLGENVCGICIAKEKWAHSPNFPSCLKNKRKEEDEMMKNLKQLLLAVIFVVAVSMTAAAQKEGDKKPPPKEGKPPVIIVNPEKKPKEEKPKADDKKPQFMMYKSNVRYEG